MNKPSHSHRSHMPSIIVQEYRSSSLQQEAQNHRIFSFYLSIFFLVETTWYRCWTWNRDHLPQWSEYVTDEGGGCATVWTSLHQLSEVEIFTPLFFGIRHTLFLVHCFFFIHIHCESFHFFLQLHFSNATPFLSVSILIKIISSLSGGCGHIPILLLFFFKKLDLIDWKHHQKAFVLHYSNFLFHFFLRFVEFIWKEMFFCFFFPLIICHESKSAGTMQAATNFNSISSHGS